jgi:lambda repressor-like predicted transcriptional regulator
MRQQGSTMTEIIAATNVAKSTLSYIFRTAKPLDETAFADKLKARKQAILASKRHPRRVGARFDQH